MPSQTEVTLKFQVDVAMENVANNSLNGAQQITLPPGYGRFKLEAVEMRASANTQLDTTTLFLSDTVLDGSAMPADEDCLYRSGVTSIGSAHARNAFLKEVPDTVANHDYAGWRKITPSTLYMMLGIVISNTTNSGTIRVTVHFSLRR